jgi:hypothetical protein
VPPPGRGVVKVQRIENLQLHAPPIPAFCISPSWRRISARLHLSAVHHQRVFDARRPRGVLHAGDGRPTMCPSWPSPLDRFEEDLVLLDLNATTVSMSPGFSPGHEDAPGVVAPCR